MNVPFVIIPYRVEAKSFCYKACSLHIWLISSVQLLSHVRLFATPWTASRQACLSITNSQSLLKLMSIESMMPSNHLILFSLFSPTFNLSQHQGHFKWVSSLHQVAKVLEFQLQHQSFQWIFRTDFLWMDWLDLLAVQVTPKSLLQHHSSKASILRHSAFFIVQLSHPYMTTGKIIALTRWTFVAKVMSLLFNMLSRLVITFLQRSKHLLNSWLQSPSVVILVPPKIKSDTVSIVYPSICHEVIWLDAMILVFWMLSFKPTILFHFPQETLFFTFCHKCGVICISEVDISPGKDSSLRFSWCILHKVK